MSHYLVRQIEATPNVDVRTGTEVVDGGGRGWLEHLVLRDRATDEETKVKAQALFLMIGAQPHTDWLAGKLERDQHGFILSGPDLLRDGRKPHGWTIERDPFLLETSVPGVFVAGDVRRGSIKRVASSVGEGAIAVQFMHQYLSKL